MNLIVIRLQGLLELTGVLGFMCGYFLEYYWIMVAGGIIVVADVLIEMGLGVLKPLFPIILAIVLALIISPWYVGIFWSSAAFKIFGIPNSINKILRPQIIY